MVLAWLAATAVSVLIASSAVATVQDQVTASPSPLQGTTMVQLAASTTVPAPDPAMSVAPTTAVTSTTTVAAVTPTSTSLPGGATTSTIAPRDPTSTSTTAPAATTTTTAAPTTTTTTATTAAPSAEFRSYELVGGLVRIRIQGDEVWFEGATPAPGFDVDIEHAGPEEVVVEFDSADHESKFRARFNDGELDIDTDEEGE